MRDPTSQESFQVLEKDWWVVARFLVNLLEPMKQFADAGSLDGDSSYGAKTRNAYNEIDLSRGTIAMPFFAKSSVSSFLS